MFFIGMIAGWRKQRFAECRGQQKSDVNDVGYSTRGTDFVAAIGDRGSRKIKNENSRTIKNHTLRDNSRRPPAVNDVGYKWAGG
jgi:hypothetical protein